MSGPPIEPPSDRLSGDALINEIDEVARKARDEIEDLLALLDDQGAITDREYESIDAALENLIDELGEVVSGLEPPDPD